MTPETRTNSRGLDPVERHDYITSRQGDPRRLTPRRLETAPSRLTMNCRRIILPPVLLAILVSCTECAPEGKFPVKKEAKAVRVLQEGQSLPVSCVRVGPAQALASEGETEDQRYTAAIERLRRETLSQKGNLLQITSVVTTLNGTGTLVSGVVYDCGV
jgi:hypothetical protein